MKSGASQSSYNSKANEAPKLATNNKFAALRDWIGGAPTYFVATPSWKANLRNFSAASPLKKSWKNTTLLCTASLKRGCYYNFITFSKQERLFYSKICYRCGYGNEINIKKRLILAVLNKKTKIAKQKMPIESFLFQYIYKTWKPNWLNTEPRKVQNKQL